MVATRSGEHVTVTADNESTVDSAPRGPRPVSPSSVDDEGVVQEGLERINLSVDGEEDVNDEAEEEGGKEEKDVDSETMHNTRVNECMTPKRMFRRRASSKLHPPSGSKSAQSPPKHVKFVDESRPAPALEALKAELHNPKASKKRKEHAREVLEFHDEPFE